MTNCYHYYLAVRSFGNELRSSIFQVFFWDSKRGQSDEGQTLKVNWNETQGHFQKKLTNRGKFMGQIATGNHRIGT